MKKVFFVFLCFFVSIAFAQKEYPCLKGNCEDSFGMKKMNDNYTYMGYHKDGKRHGLAISYNENSEDIFVFTNKEGEPDGMAFQLMVRNKQLKRININPWYNGELIYPTLSIVYTDKGVRFAGKGNSSSKSYFLDEREQLINSKPVRSRLEIISLKNNRMEAEFHRNFSTGTTTVVNQLGEDWSLDITTKPYEDRSTSKTTFHWDKDGFVVQNKDFYQILEIRDLLSFPNNLGGSSYVNDMGFTSLLKIFMNQ